MNGHLILLNAWNWPNEGKIRTHLQSEEQKMKRNEYKSEKSTNKPQITHTEKWIQPQWWMKKKNAKRNRLMRNIEKNQENSNGNALTTPPPKKWTKMKWKEKWQDIYFCGNLSILPHLMRYEAAAQYICANVVCTAKMCDKVIRCFNATLLEIESCNPNDL